MSSPNRQGEKPYLLCIISGSPDLACELLTRLQVWIIPTEDVHEGAVLDDAWIGAGHSHRGLQTQPSCWQVQHVHCIDSDTQDGVFTEEAEHCL